MKKRSWKVQQNSDADDVLQIRRLKPPRGTGVVCAALSAMERGGDVQTLGLCLYLSGLRRGRGRWSPFRPYHEDDGGTESVPASRIPIRIGPADAASPPPPPPQTAEA